MKMKKIAAVLICALFFLMSALPAMAYTEMTAPKATVTLDGVRDDSYAGPFDIKSFADGAVTGATGQVWVSWDDNYINLYFEIKDTTPNHEATNNYDRDCVEQFFDWTNSHDDDTSNLDHPFWQLRTASAPATESPTDLQPDGEQFSHAINEAANGWDENPDLITAQIANNVIKPLVGSDLNGGYILEERVPYKQFGITLAEGSVVGIDFMIGDNQDGSSRTSMAFLDPDYTSNNQYQYPNELGGELTLGPAAPAPTEAVADTAAPAPADNGTPALIAPAPVTPAPTTGDNTVAVFGVMVLAAAGFVIFRKKLFVK